MPSSPSATILPGQDARIAPPWQPAPLTRHAASVRTDFTLPTFERSESVRPSLTAFEVDRTSEVPEELLAAKTAAARASGYAVGYAEGIADARSATAARLAAEAAAAQQQAEARELATSRALEAVHDAADALEHRAVESVSDIEEQIVSAAWSIATAIVGEVIADTETRSRAAVTRALALASTDDDVTVSVSTDDFIALGGTTGSDEAHHSDDAGMTPLRRTRGLRTVTIIADPSLSPGDAVAQTGATTIDARLSTAMERVKRVLEP